MLNSKEILDVLQRNRDNLRQLGVRRLGLFGSAARGETSESSDLDFLVELDRKTFDTYMDVKELLERLFARRIDLVMADALKPQLRPPHPPGDRVCGGTISSFLRTYLKLSPVSMILSAP